MDKLWNRESLFQEVWTEPMTTVAKRYGVSGNAIAKVCRKLNIPVPGRGYWARKAHGHPVERVSLPSMKEVPRLWQPTPKPPAEVKPADEELCAIDQRLKNGEFNLGAEEQASLNSDRRSSNARRKDRIDGPKEFDIRVSAACMKRAVGIMALLCQFASRIGASVRTTKENYKTATMFSHRDTDVSFCIRERKKMVRIARPRSSYPSHSFEPTGILTLEIQEYVDLRKRSWQDGVGTRLEDQFPEVMAGFLKAAVLVRRRNEERKKREELERRQKLEQIQVAEKVVMEEKRIRVLLREVRNWRIANDVRHYLVEKERLDQAGAGEVSSAFLAWAKDQADRIDPLRPSPASILDRRKEVQNLIRTEGWRFR